MNETSLWAGVDVGSTTVKIAIVDPSDKKLLFHRYKRHNAMQPQTVLELLDEAHSRFERREFRVSFCGSGGAPFAQKTGAFFVQEVVANAVAVREMYQATKVAIELGGQDAKVIFFECDPVSGKLLASDMRMNGVCAGGTGAFIDQVAELLRIKTEEFDAYASRGRKVYEISGRCGVFAKTDIQPLLNQGVAKEDIALSSLHAIAKQTIGGLAQGMEIRPPVLFEGGPLTFNPSLVRVFKERLGLPDDQIITPERSEILVAWGAALSIEAMFEGKTCNYDQARSRETLSRFSDQGDKKTEETPRPFFESEEEKAAFYTRHPIFNGRYEPPKAGTTIRAYLGIDAGSTTTKFVLLDEEERVIESFYSGNEGDPLAVLKNALCRLGDRYIEYGAALEIAGAGTTGYGEMLFYRALRADYHTVETVAHSKAARALRKDVSFILDIGGQDMKAISVQGGVVTGIILNEACSSGCGSFIETYARSLGVSMEQIARMAFASKSPSKLGSRCTVFMNSSIITEQRDGKKPEDILAGICRSIIDNVFTKVMRLRSLDALGKTVIVQGGTFKNDAVLRAFEQYSGLTPIRPERPGEMGAIGIALLTKEFVQTQEARNPEWKSSFIGLDAMERFGWVAEAGQICRFCTNNCSRTVITFKDGSSHVTGNRCERGEIVSDPNDPETRRKVAEISRKMQAVPDMFKRTNRLLIRDYQPKPLLPPNGVTIGIPRALEFWNSLPFWNAFFTSLGYRTVISRASDYALFEEGLQSVPSDTVCFPAKLLHGHVADLVRKKVDRIFLPAMIAVISDHKRFKATAVCPVVQGYPVIVRNTDDPETNFGIPLDQPTFHWYSLKLQREQTVNWFYERYKLPKRLLSKAVSEAEKALLTYQTALFEEGAKILADARARGEFAVVIAGRPYHADLLVNHHVASHFTALGIPVLTVESIREAFDQDVAQNTRMEEVNSYHMRLIGAALLVRDDPALEMVQIVSFGCGHDATLSDEVIRILRKSNKELLMLKLDEGDVPGPLNIRIKSFIETVRSRRNVENVKKETGEPLFRPPFTKEDKKRRKVLIPNLSPAFSFLCAKILERKGYDAQRLPLADRRAIELGKRYVHNDICFPAQVNIGEGLRYLEQHPELPAERVAMGLAKNCENCRAGQYAVLCRKALDEAGYEKVPIVTTGSDSKNMHPGFRADFGFRIHMVWGMAIMDVIEAMVRAVRPYEISEGETLKVYQRHIHEVMSAAAYDRRKALKLLERAVDDFNAIAADRSERKPRVAVLGEILMKYHPSANGFVEDYLIGHGMEVIQPGIIDFFRSDEMIRLEKVKRGLIEKPFLNWAIGGISVRVYKTAVDAAEKRFKRFKFYERRTDCYDMADKVEGIIDRTYQTGEGWLIPAEILSQAENGVNSFIILQPFACLANHISGRGLTKAVKARFPHIQVLSLDYDPDTSFANIENRLQMLIINAKENMRR
ncbi:MAG: acyl-CoA dehydratase activase [Helicobacteraceae bacterium]|jgi:predicted CoA-substrate-specific enzyme activase|nr:acyl-CoA dehydratase activase [Helicobacteraceae bacterium]